ncbi:MAG: hypothetical protein JW751_10165 [Polyangiaceae bacterium]|nr:hypothetical protein [Polyangiaceae bacterium]
MAARAPLRLSVTRGVLGLELYDRVELGPLSVQELALTLPNLTFPVDLSGGVAAFRNRRGKLARLEVSLELERLSRWVGPRVRAVTQGAAEVRVWGIEAGVGVGLSGPSSALVFDLLWAPVDTTVRFVVANARGAGFSGPVLAQVLRAIDSCVGGWVTRRGRVVTIEHAARAILREVLPLAGARVPEAKGARPCGLDVVGSRLEIAFDEAALPPALSDAACRALELAGLVTLADDALVEGRPDAARAAYMEALERAPRHPEISRIVAEIDLAHVGRSESALGLLVDAEAALHAGWVAAELLAAVGDREGARAALAEAIARESYGPVAARFGMRLAELADDARARMTALDEAVARAPAVAAVRWARIEARLHAADVLGAISDGEHLEAAARGARVRHAACRRLAAALMDAGYVRQAGQWFERALRYVGDDPFATAGLGRSMVAAGRAARAVALLERAIELGAATGESDPDAALDLALLLANEYRDLPAAIARTRTVTAASSRVVEARALEARWRAALGDIAGASLAHSRTREAIELSIQCDPTWANWLLEAARFERDVQRDLFAAERHLSIALRIAPHDEAVGRTFREVAAITARLRCRREGAPGPDAAGVDPGPMHPVFAAGALLTEATSTTDGANQRAAAASLSDGIDALEEDAAGGSLADEEEIVRLEGALRANPEDVEAAVRLGELLERLGRDLELFALVSARLEEASRAEREALLPLARSVLSRLETQARDAGRAGEVDLFVAFRRRLDEG